MALISGLRTQLQDEGRGAESDPTVGELHVLTQVANHSQCSAKVFIRDTGIPTHIV